MSTTNLTAITQNTGYDMSMTVTINGTADAFGNNTYTYVNTYEDMVSQPTVAYDIGSITLDSEANSLFSRGNNSPIVNTQHSIVTSGVDLIISYTNTLVGNSSLHDIRNGSLASSDSNTIFFAIAVPNINFKYGPIDIDITSNNRINKAPTITAGNNAYATATVNVESIGASNTFTFASTSTSTTVIGNKGSISISNDTAQSSISNEANTLTNNSQTLLGDFVKLNPLFIGSLGDINTIENKAISTLQHIAGSGGQDASIASQLESFLIPQHYYG